MTGTLLLDQIAVLCQGVDVSRLGYVCIYGAQGTGELVQLFDDVRIRDQGDAENSGVGQRVEGDADVAWVHRGGHNG